MADLNLGLFFIIALFGSTLACGPMVQRHCVCPGPCCVSNVGGGLYPDYPIHSLHSVLGGNIRMEGKLRDEKLSKFMLLAPGASRRERISSSQDLMCTVWDNLCHWHNLDDNAVDWNRGTGTPDAFRLQASTGSSASPRTPFAVVATNRVLKSSESATLISDAVPCQAGDGEIRFLYWTSPQVRITVCWRKVHSQTNDYCSPAISGGNPGPAMIRIPGPILDPFEILLTADNFVYNDGRYKGGFAMIDDLEYNAEICTGTDTTNGVFSEQKKEAVVSSPPSIQPVVAIRIIQASNDDEEACKLIQCNFREGPCMDYVLRSDFNIHQGSIGNPVTGIRGDGSISPFNSTGEFAYAVGPRDVAHFVLPPFVLQQSRRLQFAYYRAAINTKLRVTVQKAGERDSAVFETPDADINSRRWQFESIPLDAGKYESVILEAVDLKKNTFIGIDEIRLIDAVTERPIC